MKKKIIIAVSITLFITLILAAYYYKLSTRNAVEIIAADGKLINILVTGSNRSEPDKNRFYAVFSINPENKFLGITFIPPTYLIKSSGENPLKISEVELSEFEVIKKSLKEDLRLNIPFYVNLESKGLEVIVDFFDGIDQFVLDSSTSVKGSEFGLNYFDGEKTLKYINDVELNSIYLKYDRIQNLIFTILSNRNRYVKYFNLPFISIISKYLKTNLFPQEIESISKILADGTEVFATILPGYMDNGYYKLDEISHKSFEESILKPLVSKNRKDAVLKIRILNGTNVSGLAKKIRKKMMRQGLSVIEFSTSPYPKSKKSIIICRKADSSIAKMVIQRTGIKNIHYVTNQELYNVLVIVGEDMINYGKK